MENIISILQKHHLPYISREWLLPRSIVWSTQLNNIVQVIDVYENNSLWYVDVLYGKHVFTFVYSDYEYFKDEKEYRKFKEELRCLQE